MLEWNSAIRLDLGLSNPVNSLHNLDLGLLDDSSDSVADSAIVSNTIGPNAGVSAGRMLSEAVANLTGLNITGGDDDDGSEAFNLSIGEILGVFVMVVAVNTLRRIAFAMTNPFGSD